MIWLNKLKKRFSLPFKVALTVIGHLVKKAAQKPFIRVGKWLLNMRFLALTPDPIWRLQLPKESSFLTSRWVPDNFILIHFLCTQAVIMVPRIHISRKVANFADHKCDISNEYLSFWYLDLFGVPNCHHHLKSYFDIYCDFTISWKNILKSLNLLILIFFSRDVATLLQWIAEISWRPMEQKALILRASFQD